MNKKTTMWVIVIGILLILACLGYYYSKNNNATKAVNETATNEQDMDDMNMQATPAATATPEPTTGVDVGVSVGTPKTVTFNVEGGSFFFKPNVITVKKGDTVKIVFKNSGGMHNWVLDEFNAKTSIIKSGETQTIEFVASKTGSFEYYCSVGTHRQMGMKGTLIVE